MFFLQFSVENDNANGAPIRFLGPMPSSCIQSLKIESAGQLVELIEEYAKVYSAFDSLLPQAARATAAAQGLGMVNEGKAAGVLKSQLPVVAAAADQTVALQRTFAEQQEAHAIFDSDADIKRAIDGSDRYKSLAPDQTEICIGSFLS